MIESKKMDNGNAHAALAAHKRALGTGLVHQGRLTSFPVQTDEQFITVAR